jgi:hypothetical protein
MMDMPNTNAAYDALLRDYTRYHAVFVILGGLATTAIAATTIVLWSRYRRVRAAGERNFERKLYFRLAILNSLFVAFMALAFAANLSTTLHPQPGLDALIAAPQPTGGQTAVVDGWLRAGTAKVPPAIQAAVDQRLDWQAPKAAISAILLVGVAFVAVRIWSALIRRSATISSNTTPNPGLLVSGIATTMESLVLIVMAIANTQASLAPLAITALGAHG